MQFTNEMLECLERAAQLTGGEWRQVTSIPPIMNVVYVTGRKIWNPLDSGDLLELAVLRGMTIETDRKTEVEVRSRRLRLGIVEQITGPKDYLDATKRAILKLAIKMGRVP